MPPFAVLDFKSWFKSKTARRQMKDLSAETMAHAATALLRRSGRNLSSLRLVYHALVEDPQEPEAMLRLSDFIRDLYPESKPRGNGLLSGILLEWMGSVNPPRPLSPENKKIVDLSRAKLMRMWGFSRVKESSIAVAPTAVMSDAQLEFDELGYLQFISRALEHIGSYQAAFEMAHEVLGYHAKFLELKVPGPLTSFMDASHFKVSPAYKEWLQLDAASIEQQQG